MSTSFLTYLVSAEFFLPRYLRSSLCTAAVMREGLRLGTTAPARTVTPIEDTVLGGKYTVKKGDFIIIVTSCVHRDPKIWGEDANEFRPERMMDGKFEALPVRCFSLSGFPLMLSNLYDNVAQRLAALRFRCPRVHRAYSAHFAA